MPELITDKGVTVKGTFSRDDGTTYFNIAFESEASKTLNNFAIQFNKNTFGLKPDEASFTCKVPSGGKGSYNLPVSAVPAMVRAGAPNNTVYIYLNYYTL